MGFGKARESERRLSEEKQKGLETNQNHKLTTSRKKRKGKKTKSRWTYNIPEAKQDAEFKTKKKTQVSCVFAISFLLLSAIAWFFRFLVITFPPQICHIDSPEKVFFS